MSETETTAPAAETEAVISTESQPAVGVPAPAADPQDEARLRREDVVSAWAGIRPLMPTTGSSVSASREHAVDQRDGSVTITGGKLTTYRVMARQVVDAVQEILGLGSRSRTDTRAMRDDSREMNALSDGSGELRAEIVAGLPYRMGEMRWAVDRELACTLGDLLIRRTHVAFETPDNGRAGARRVATFLDWDAQSLEIRRRGRADFHDR